MAADGVANSKIAATVGVTPVTVRSWRGRFADEGLSKFGRPVRGTSLVARPVRWWCSSMGRSRCTSSAGGKTLLSWTDDPALLQSAADALALAVREGALGKLTVEKADGASVLRPGHPLATALAGAGFHATPRGLRLRR